MKFNVFGRIFCVLAVSLFAIQANGTIIISDNFDYPDGDITTVSNGIWTAHSGDQSNPVQVDSGQAVLTHGSGSRDDVSRSFTAMASGTIYYGFDFSVDDLGEPYSGTDNEYFAHFNSNGGFSGRMDVVPPNAAGDFSVGIATFSSTADATWATDLSYDTMYRAIVLYDIDEDQATLWIDPTSEASTSILGADGTVPTTIDSFALRQSNSSADETIRVDGLVVGTTFNDVLTAVPEPTACVLFGTLALGAIALRKRFS